uniref:Uncharacterized protein n=1 Tax=Nelumbo nucifera TaxID=4432 RepID=A0A822ZQ09_NELNU|nr:TPA_asm: hypothetical protein HUJ06_003246 [Nelumbo nucifera]
MEQEVYKTTEAKLRKCKSFCEHLEQDNGKILLFGISKTESP